MGRRYLFSGSSFGRTEQCPAWTALRHIDTYSRASTEGVGLHAFVAPIAEGATLDVALSQIEDPAVRAWAEKIDASQIPRGLAERSMAYDPETGLARFTGDAQRRYTLEPGEIPMTPDLLVIDGPGVPLSVPTELLMRPGYARSLGVTDLTVVDFKSTRFDHDPGFDEPQLAINALAAASIFGVDRAGVAVGVITDDGAITWTRGELDAARLDAVAKRVRRAYAAALVANAERDAVVAAGSRYEPSVRRGHECRWCPAQLTCPGTRAALALATGEHFGLVEAEPGPAYTRVQAVERFAEAARQIIKNVVATYGDQETGDGRVLTLDSRGSLKLKKLRT